MKTLSSLLLAGVIAAVLAVTGAYALASALVVTPQEAVDKVSSEIEKNGGDPSTDERQPASYGTR
ncbi:hypothetical protein K1W54_05740 [Micromonospora sp. CPCC 205371]|nr:hypothetical protein [Micromonospora sp. CPCC 205371]